MKRAAFALLLTGCAWMQGGGAKSVIDVARAIECVVQHDSEPDAQIVADCAQYGIQTIQDLAAVRKAGKTYGACK